MKGAWWRIEVTVQDIGRIDVHCASRLRCSREIRERERDCSWLVKVVPVKEEPWTKAVFSMCARLSWRQKSKVDTRNITRDKHVHTILRSLSVEKRRRKTDLKPSIATVDLSMLHSDVEKRRFCQQGGGRDTKSITRFSEDGKVRTVDDVLPAFAHGSQLDFDAGQVPSWEYGVHRIEVAVWFKPLRRWTYVRGSGKIAIVIGRVKREYVNGFGRVGENALKDVVCFQNTVQKIEST